MKHVGQHAIVIGASMSGLLAARALSDFFAVVTVLERDALPRADIPRKGVRPGRHREFLSRLDRWGRCLRRRQGRHRRRRELDRSWRYHQVGAR